MKTFNKVAIALVIAVGMTGCVVTPTVTGINDPLESHVTVNTRAFDKPYIIMYGKNDSFFIVNFDKATGERGAIHLYVITNTQGSKSFGTYTGAPHWNRATTLVNKVAVNMNVNVVDTRFECSTGNCIVYTDARMVITEAVLDQWNKGGIIRLKSGSSNQRRDVKITAAEVAHLRVEMGKINL